MVFLISSCEEESKTKFALQTVSTERERNSLKIEMQQTDSIAEKWQILAFDKGGCLGGQQYNWNEKAERSTLVFSSNEWKRFVHNDKRKLTEFLLKKLSDTMKTKIHTCPFFTATGGEMAVYSLQYIHHKNWYDFKEFLAYKNREMTSATDQLQTWLQNVLKDKKQREKLADLYRSELRK